MSSEQQTTEDQPQKKLKRSDFGAWWSYTEALADDAIKKLEAKPTLESLELAVTRAKEFESKRLPALKTILGDSVDWLPEIKSFSTQTDEEVTIIPSPLIHFASLCCRVPFNHKTLYWDEMKWCYCPVNDFIVLMTESKTFVVHPEDNEGLKTVIYDVFPQEKYRVPLSEYLARDKSEE